MSRQQTVQRIQDCGIVAVVRSADGSLVAEAAQALADGGVVAIEITMTVPDALTVIRTVRHALGQRVVAGAGTVLDGETARAAILAGADFVVGPAFCPELVRICHRYDRAVMPGTFTATEVLRAWESGADVVKLFPAEVGGPRYLKSLLGPLPQVRLMPTGGVNLQTAADFLRAGACCLGVGGALIEPQALKRRDWDRLRHLAAQYVSIVRQTRGVAQPG